MRSLNLTPVTVMAGVEHWKQFTALARSRELSISALLRQMVAKELRRAARLEETTTSHLSGGNSNGRHHKALAPRS
jgi:post-segregation antitoxin (ccd killing protein)